MKSFRKYFFENYQNNDVLEERVINITRTEDKQKVAKDVWDILQKSYAYIGGIKGNGFESIDNMINKIPYWKIARKNNKIVAVILYKDKNGRKLVACGSDGSKEGKYAIKRFLLDDVKHQRAYGEVSDSVLKFYKRNLTPDEIRKFFIPAKEVKNILKDKNIKITGEYTYERIIGGEPHEKMMYGKTGQGFKGINENYKFKSLYDEQHMIIKKKKKSKQEKKHDDELNYDGELDDDHPIRFFCGYDSMYKDEKYKNVY